MNEALATAAEKKIGEAGYVFTINYNLGDGKQLQVVGNFSKGATKQEMNAELDKIRQVFRRQRLVELEIPAVSNGLQEQGEKLDNVIKQLDTLRDQYRETAKIPVQVRQQFHTLEETIRKMEEAIPAGKMYLAQMMEQRAALDAEI
jgi:uncharacterized coiled-coil DUF342 family protein